MPKNLRLMTSERALNIASAAIATVVAVYIACMFIAPWFEGRGSWAYVQSVWYNWQPLNVGVLAFTSSVIALNISRFNAKNQRERSFRAAKAFLPEALSELVSYFKSSADVLREGWSAAGHDHAALEAPQLPQRYKSVFTDCITHAEPDVGQYLSRILVLVQVHDARIRDFVRQLADTSYANPNKHNLITYFYRIGQLQALTGNLFAFARGDSEFAAKPLVWEDFRNAYANLDLWLDDIRIDDKMNLETFTRRRLEQFSGVDA